MDNIQLDDPEADHRVTKYEDQRVIFRSCSLCGRETSASTLPSWLHQMKVHYHYEVCLCSDCYKLYAPGITEAIIDKVDNLIREIRRHG